MLKCHCVNVALLSRLLVCCVHEYMQTVGVLGADMKYYVGGKAVPG